MKTFMLKGKRETYKVSWKQDGFSYAVPVVKVKRRVPLLGFAVWRKVWEGSSDAVLTAMKMTPNDLWSWYSRAVNEYEEYVSAWEEVK